MTTREQMEDSVKVTNALLLLYELDRKYYVIGQTRSDVSVTKVITDLRKIRDALKKEG